MKLHSILRILSIICYFFTFLQGMIIALPFIGVLTFGIGNAEPEKRVFLILADLALIILGILSCKKETKGRILVKCVIYFVLLSPLVWTLANFPLRLFNFFLFIGPFFGFVVLYPLSLLFSCQEYRAAKMAK